MTILTSALAETTVEAAAPTVEQAAAGGLLFGMTAGVAIALGIIWFILQAMADWKIFAKAGKAGWKAFIPVLNSITEYDICWNPLCGLIYVIALFLEMYGNQMGVTTPTTTFGIVCAVAAIVGLVFHCIESVRLAKSFGKGIGFGICLIIFGPICRLILGFGSAEYVGKQ